MEAVPEVQCFGNSQLESEVLVPVALTDAEERAVCIAGWDLNSVKVPN